MDAIREDTIREDAIKEDDERLKITELINLRNLGVSITDINFSRIKVTSIDYICARHKKRVYGTKQDKTLTSRKQSLPNLDEINRRQQDQEVISIIDSNSTEIKSYELNHITAAAMCPMADDKESGAKTPLLAMSSADKIYVLDITTDKVVAWNRFPFVVRYWNWINNSYIAMIGDSDVVHWNIITDNMQYIFKINPRLINAEIISYKSSNDLSWFAITGLIASDAESGYRKRSDAHRNIEGLTQIYSVDQDTTNVVLAQSVAFVSYAIGCHKSASNILVTINKSAPNLIKISLTELYSRRNGDTGIVRFPDQDSLDAISMDADNKSDNASSNSSQDTDQDVGRQPLISKSTTVYFDRSDDIPISILHQEELLFVTTKHGLLYAFHFESLTPLIVAKPTSNNILISTILDPNNNTESDKDADHEFIKNCPSIIAINKSGQVLNIELNMKLIIRRLLNDSHTEAKIKIAQKLIKYFNIDMNTAIQVTRL